MPLKIFLKSLAVIPALCKLLKAGEVIAAPTETAYGLLVDATNQKAVSAVYKLKGRGKGKPLPLVFFSLGQAKKYARFSKLDLLLAKKFWPGPLTLVLPARFKFPAGVVSRNKEVGLRVTSSVWLNNLIFKYKRPLVATSANLAGKPTPYTSSAVARNLKIKGLKYLVQGGSLFNKPTSTVLRTANNKLTILRTGAIPVSKLKKVLPSSCIINS